MNKIAANAHLVSKKLDLVTCGGKLFFFNFNNMTTDIVVENHSGCDDELGKTHLVTFFGTK